MVARALLLTAWLGVCSVLGGAAATAVANESAQEQAQRQTEQPLNNAPVWRAVRYGEEHSTQATGREAGVLIQSAGEAWRQIRNGPVTRIGGWLLILVPIAIGLFYRWNGPLKLHGQLTGRLVQRFSYWERLVHWSTAITFVVLSVTGVLMLFGRYVLIPLMGYGAFAWIAQISKNVHNLVGPLFIVSVACMFALFVRDNIWHSIDWHWLKKAPQVLSGRAHVPSGKYNAAEKGWFWGGVAFLGLVVGLSGLVLDFPNFEQTRAAMQVANVVHGVGALLFVAASLGHIYMGTIGTEGAYEAMRTGYVDETWAKEHHELWFDEVKS
ncbi:MAG: formate dehydrogenase subunit gamma [Burkholderiales bacterium]|nr:formate dehydrogenase subunit gamma [Burkholderiales bacterium]